MVTQKIIKVGNSLGVTLPSPLVKSLSLRPGDLVEITQEESNSITYNFIDSHQLSLGLPATKRRASKDL